MSRKISIAIIGAGPAGLTLARLLHISSATDQISITVFEKDASPTARLRVGGTLDLHDETGLAALRQAGLWSKFQKYARYDGEALVITDKNATRLVDLKGGSAGMKQEEKENGAAKARPEANYARPEIDREKLREILLESVPREMVRWGWKLATAPTDDGMLRFTTTNDEDGTAGEEQLEGPFDLIVGADGAWSKVRSILSEVKPAYAGVCGMEIRISNPNEEFPKLSKMVGQGSYFTYSDGKSLNAQRMGNGSIKVGTWIKTPDNQTWPQDLIAAQGKHGAREELLRKYADWASELLDLIRAGDTGYLVPWSLYELPVGHRWAHQKGFTLIGDAASLMTPFAGEGVNKAMKDALELADAVVGGAAAAAAVAADGDLDAAVQKYEEVMFPRSAKIQAETFRNKTNMFGPEAPVSVLMGFMTKFAEMKAGTWEGTLLASWPVLALTYSYFWTKVTVGRLARWYWIRR